MRSRAKSTPRLRVQGRYDHKKAPAKGVQVRTYGRLWYEDGKWCFDVEPHVAVVLKRLFPKLSPAAKRLVLSETPGSARDVEWVLQRFPLEMPTETADYVRCKADAAREQDRLMDEFLSGVRPPRAFELAIPA